MAMRLVTLLGVLAISGCATTTSRLGLPPLETVPHVEVQRYLGTWYELASIPQSFQRGCTATTATYSLRPDGELDVLNKCRMDSVDGVEKTATGRARVVDAATNAKLEVSFFRPFWGDYWIIDLDPEYQWASVSDPTGNSYFLLTRTKTIDPALKAEIIARAEAKGVKIGNITDTPQF